MSVKRLSFALQTSLPLTLLLFFYILLSTSTSTPRTINIATANCGFTAILLGLVFGPENDHLRLTSLLFLLSSLFPSPTASCIFSYSLCFFCSPNPLLSLFLSVKLLGEAANGFAPVADTPCDF